MKQNPLKKIPLIAFFFGSYAFYIWLRVQHGLRIHEPRTSFGDTPDYLRIASQSLFSPQFWIANKPPVTPLFFKLFNSDPEKIFSAQLWISIISWGLLALMVSLVVNSCIVKPLAFVIVLGFSLGQNVIMWDPLLLSDSLAMSLLALFLASAIWLISEWRIYKVITLTFISLLLVLVRDTYAYWLLMIAILLLVLLFLSHHRKRVLLVSGIFLCYFLLVTPWHPLDIIGMPRF